MPSQFPETYAAMFGAYLVEDGWAVKDAEEHIDCDDRTIRHANRVRRSEDRHDRSIWTLMVVGRVRVGDAEALVGKVERRFPDQPLLQRNALRDAVQQFESGRIRYLRHYSV